MEAQQDTEAIKEKELVRKCLSRAFKSGRVVELFYHSLLLMKKHNDKTVTEILGEAMRLCYLIKSKK